MKTFKVRWTMDLEARDEVDAVRQAKEIQQDPESVANYFQIVEDEIGTGHLPEVIGEVDLDDSRPSFRRIAR